MACRDRKANERVSPEPKLPCGLMSAIQTFLARADSFLSRIVARLPPPLNDLRVRFRLQAGAALALIASFLAILLYWTSLLAPLDRLATDFLYHSTRPQPQIAIIAIDKKSLDEIGTFPWSRAIHAQLLQRLAQAPPRVIAFDIVFAPPTAEDASFASALAQAGNAIVVATAADESGIMLQPDALPVFSQIVLPDRPIAQSASGIGHRIIFPDADKLTRQIPTAIQAGETTLPALGLLAAAKFLGAPAPEIRASSRSVMIGKIRLPTDEYGNTLLNFTNPNSDLATYSYVDVLNGAVSPETFANKLVFIGGNSTIESEQYAIPLQLGQARTYNVNLQADLANMLLSVPPQTLQAQGILGQFGLILAMAMLAGLTIPHVRFLYGVAMTLLYLAALLLLAFDAFNRGIILHTFYPALALVLTSASIITFRHFSEERRRQFLTLLFRRYVPAEIVGHVIEAIDRGDLRLSGTRRMVTVLYADLRGFAVLSEEIKPEVVLQTVNRYLEIAVRAISAHGGTVSKPMGDALVGIWNAPLDQENHRALGLDAAVEMRQKILQYQKKNPEQEQFSVAIGLVTGWAVMGNMNALGKVEYTLVGETVNIAARISAFANNNQILADSATTQDAPEQITVRELSPVRVRGRKEPLPVWEVREANPPADEIEEE